MQLRPYQIKTIDAARDLLRQGPIGCVQAPTGAGKTVMFATIAKTMATASKVCLILVNRENLMQQVCKTLIKLGVEYSKVHGDDITISQRVVVSTVQTFSKLYKAGYRADLTMIDECHISIFDKYVQVQLDAKCKVLGWTATPYRMNKKKYMQKLYQRLATPCKTEELIEAGALVRPKYLMAEIDLSGLEVGSDGDFSDESQEKVFADIDSFVNEFKKHHLGKSLVFAPSIAMATTYAEALTAAGIPAKMICGDMDIYERRRLIKQLRNGQLMALTNADLLTFGFDMPELLSIAVMRATQSLALWHQMIGRVARIAEGKTTCRVLDFGGNIMRLGIWEEDIDWHIHFNAQPKKNEESTPAVSACPECGCFFSVNKKVCPDCGWEKPRPDNEEEEEIYKAKLVEFASAGYNELDLPNRSISDLIMIAEQRKYKKSWIRHVLAGRPDNVNQLTEYFKMQGKPNPVKSALEIVSRLVPS